MNSSPWQCIALLILLPAACHGADIQGRILDGITKNPVAGVKVQIHVKGTVALPVKSVVTAKDGKYAFTGLKPGQYTLGMQDPTPIKAPSAILIQGVLAGLFPPNAVKELELSPLKKQYFLPLMVQVIDVELKENLPQTQDMRVWPKAYTKVTILDTTGKPMRGKVVMTGLVPMRALLTADRFLSAGSEIMPEDSRWLPEAVMSLQPRNLDLKGEATFVAAVDFPFWVFTGFERSKKQGLHYNLGVRVFEKATLGVEKMEVRMPSASPISPALKGSIINAEPPIDQAEFLKKAGDDPHAFSKYLEKIKTARIIPGTVTALSDNCRAQAGVTDGHFEFRSLPPGKYLIDTYHEKVEVTVDGNKTAEVVIDYAK
jgi:hypothetical protein